MVEARWTGEAEVRSLNDELTGMVPKYCAELGCSLPRSVINEALVNYRSKLATRPECTERVARLLIGSELCGMRTSAASPQDSVGTCDIFPAAETITPPPCTAADRLVTIMSLSDD